MMIIRPGTRMDVREATELLNEIIAEGGTTALTNPLTTDEFWGWVGANPDKSIWHVAELDGVIMGFQWIGPWADLPPEAVEIGTFVRLGQTGLGIGSRLFEATKSAARAMGYLWIEAEIRADNTGGLIYYQSRGFEPYGQRTGVALTNGQVVTKKLTRFDLR